MGEIRMYSPEEAKDFLAEETSQDQSKFEKSIFESTELSDDETQALLERLNTPAVEVDYTNPDRVNVKTNSYHYEFGFNVAGESDKDLHVYIDWLKTEATYGRAHLPDPVDVFFPEEWKMIDSLSFYVNDETKALQLKDILPEDLQIYFYPSNEFVNASYHHERKMVVLLGGDMTSPINIASLLHEIGHAWDEVNVQSGQAERVQEGKNSDLMEKLRKERVANAFALKSIRNFVKDDPQLRDDLHKYLKNYALQSYHLGIGEDIKRREEMSVVAQEMAKDWDMDNFEAEEGQRAMFEEFTQWKETEEYLSWKQLGEYKEIKDYEEFGAWREWCEGNGRAWWKVV